MAHSHLWRRDTAPAARGTVFWDVIPGGRSKKAKGKRQKYCGGVRRRTFFEAPASCQHFVSVEGRRAAGSETYLPGTSRGAATLMSVETFLTRLFHNDRVEKSRSTRRRGIGTSDRARAACRRGSAASTPERARRNESRTATGGSGAISRAGGRARRGPGRNGFSTG
jgi:hypothetical protein